MLVELGFETFWRNKFGMYQSPVIWTIASLAVCVIAWLLISFRPAMPLRSGPSPWPRYLVGFALFAFGAVFCAVRLESIIQEYAVNAKDSDIIPSLEFYVRRWLSGDTVYKPMPFDGYEVNPTYFPLLWMPYAFSEILSIDYRWTAYGIFLIAIFLYHLKLLKQDIGWGELIFKSLVPFLFVYSFTQNAKGTFGHAVELLPVGFYLLLTLTIFHRNRFFMAVGIVLCLLSRYAFTFWLPLYMLIYWFENGFKSVFRVSLYVALGVVMLYVLPFLVKDHTILTKGLGYYAKTAEGQWYPQGWQEPGAKPHHLTQGLSFAIYFYDYGEGDVLDKLSLNRKVHITVCGFAALLLGLGYVFFRRRGLNTKLYLLIGLKFYLIIFYGFFYVPFAYLFKLPLFLSVAILYNTPFNPKRLEGS